MQEVSIPPWPAAPLVPIDRRQLGMNPIRVL